MKYCWLLVAGCQKPYQSTPTVVLSGVWKGSWELFFSDSLYSLHEILNWILQCRIGCISTFTVLSLFENSTSWYPEVVSAKWYSQIISIANFELGSTKISAKILGIMSEGQYHICLILQNNQINILQKTLIYKIQIYYGSLFMDQERKIRQQKSKFKYQADVILSIMSVW